MQGTTALPSNLTTIRARRTGAAAVARSNLIVGVLLIATMLIGAYFRFVGLNWDDFTHLHPDERFLTDVAQGLGRQLNPSGNEEERQKIIDDCLGRYPNTNGIGGYFDAECSALNPLNANSAHGLYVYGTLPLFIARGSAEVYAQAMQWYGRSVLGLSDYDGSFWTTYDGVHLVWRILSALSEMGCIVFVFAIGLRLHDKWVGLVAAFLYAVTVFSIQMGHFGTTDAMSNFFATLTVLAAVQVQRSGKLWTYLLFGFAFGCAISSRINLLPLGGLLLIAIAIQVFPVLGRGTPMRERDRTVVRHFVYFIVSMFLAVLCFRLFNPYAFDGPGFLDVFDFNRGFPFIAFHWRWLRDMGIAQGLVQGISDSPPNFQWIARTPYLFPLDNIVLWGLGVPLGIAACLGFAWSLWRIVRGRQGALANILLVVFIGGYFAYFGRQWVTTMRYFLPLYPALALLAGWGLVGAWRWSKERRPALRIVVRTLLVFVPAFTLLWAAMFTNIYRHLLTRVAASYWTMENIPGDFAMTIEGAPEGTPLINIPIAHRDTDEPLVDRVSRLNSLTPRAAVRFTAPADGEVTHMFAPHLGDPNDDPDPEDLRFTIQTVPDFQTVATAELNVNLPRDQHILGNSYDIAFDAPFTVHKGQVYEFAVQLGSADDAVISGGSVVTWEGAWDDPVPTGVCRLPDGVTLKDNPPPGLIWDARGCERLSPWWGLFNGYKQDIVYEDVPEKRVKLLETLQNSDYIIISSNRFYDTLSRNPQRWPMTNLYYDKLFKGELGYDLVATFQQTFELGPLRVSDSYLPTFDAPKWLNEFEAEEAFTVYDHPVVFIFKKSPTYNHEQNINLLYSVPLDRVDLGKVNYNDCPDSDERDRPYCDPQLVNVYTLSSAQAAVAPTRLMLTSETRPIQYDGGTWSERFNSSSVVNTEPIVTVVSWWAVILLFGLVTFPALFALLPGLPLRGYGFAKFAGMFTISWALWVLASQRIPVWSQMGIAGGMVVMALISVALVWRRRAEFGAFLRANWRRMLVIELITLIAFLAFLAVRLTNPDLWHPSFGGEKPMDFAYFNAILRSTIFPPYDPWFEGGFLNYYYFGYVIVGSPVLLLKMIPSIAYNLILPTLFALTGISAFTVAFDLVAAVRRYTGKFKITATPMVAGIAALIFCVVLGNLDTSRVFLTGVARAGGYSTPAGLQSYLTQQYIDTYHTQPDDAGLLDIINRANNPSFGDKFGYEVSNSVNIVVSIAKGIGAMAGGQPVPIGAERWFWGPSRVLAETPGVEGQAITEMPMFTYIYGDMHAHMISMPMQLMIIGLLLNEVLVAGSRFRRRNAEAEESDALYPYQDRPLFLSALMVCFIGMTIGMLRATNTWDWITYLLLGGVVMVVSWWLAQGSRVGDAPVWKRITRRSSITFVGTVGGYFVASVVGSLPYTTWYAAIYNSIKPWNDGKTPIWAYFDVNGLFLFLIVSLLIWETARWLRSVYVRDLRGRLLWIILGILVVIGVVAASFVLALMQWQVSLIVIPLLLWTGILFFRPEQSRPMQFVLLIIGLALGLTLGVEFIVLDGDIGRQNTVFKFYMQAWLMLSVVGGAIFAWLFASLHRWSRGVRGTWVTICALLIFVAALFPVMAARGKAVFRFDTEQPFTLDGAAFMNYAKQYEGDPEILSLYPDRAPFPLDEDYRMIRWLQENIQGTPVIIEGLSNNTLYRWNGRISIYTGLPAVLGWDFHQQQQRTLEPMPQIVQMRNANVDAFYQLPSIGMAWEMINFYQIQYIIVGRLERAYFDDAGLAKFEQMVNLGLLEPVYRDGESVIYHVANGAELQEFG